jgi:hypothetical protein
VALFAANLQVIRVARQFLFLVGLETDEFHIDPRRNSKVHIEVGGAELHGALNALRGCRASYEGRHQHAAACRLGGDGIYFLNVGVAIRFQAKPSFRWKAPCHFEGRDLITHLFKDWQSIADLLRKGIKLRHQPAGRIREVRKRKVRHRRQGDRWHGRHGRHHV